MPKNSKKTKNDNELKSFGKTDSFKMLFFSLPFFLIEMEPESNHTLD